MLLPFPHPHSAWPDSPCIPVSSALLGAAEMQTGTNGVAWVRVRSEEYVPRLLHHWWRGPLLPCHSADASISYPSSDGGEPVDEVPRPEGTSLGPRDIATGGRAVSVSLTSRSGRPRATSVRQRTKEAVAADPWASEEPTKAARAGNRSSECIFCGLSVPLRLALQFGARACILRTHAGCCSRCWTESSPAVSVRPLQIGIGKAIVMKRPLR